MFDLLIKNGSVIDGSGEPLYVADIGIQDGKIVSINDSRNTEIAEAKETIDAQGKLVTPGFIDVHTHYDAQATWSKHLTPSSIHGVTTVVLGNCGVGFAPCRKDSRQGLVKLMEGVEDIPGVVMAEGLPWDWETFPDYMNSLEKRSYDIDLAVMLPHSPLRVYTMRERALAGEQASTDDINNMALLAKEAAEVGAIGFATSRIALHKSIDGELIPSYKAGSDELKAIAQGMAVGGAAIVQSSFSGMSNDESMAELQVFGEVSKYSGLPFSFSLAQMDESPDLWQKILRTVDELNAQGVELTAQVLPRPVGLLIGLDSSAHPFSQCPSYLELAHLPLEKKVARLQNPQLKARLLLEEPVEQSQFIIQMARQKLDAIFELESPPNYEPEPENSIAARATSAGVSALEYVYDLLLKDNGHTLLFVPLANYSYKSLDVVNKMLDHPAVKLGLGDGGAHYGLICDASYTTFMLTYWTRDRKSSKWSVVDCVKRLSCDQAKLFGLRDRGLLKVGYKADINIIDYDNLQLNSPVMKHDLPAGGKRLYQTAEGYVRTIVDGVTTYANGNATGELPGRLVRGQQHAP